MDRCSGGVNEHPPGRFDTDDGLFDLVPRSLRRQHANSGGVQVDRPTGVVHLATRHLGTLSASLRPFSFAARRAANRSAVSRFVPAGCQLRRPSPVIGSALKDDRTPTVALLCYIALHDDFSFQGADARNPVEGSGEEPRNQQSNSSRSSGDSQCREGSVGIDRDGRTGEKRSPEGEPNVDGQAG
jgi:hypothetical protein